MSCSECGWSPTINKTLGGNTIISVGVDVSKGKSTVCILKPYGEILMAPKDYAHTQSDMSNLVTKLKAYDDEMHIIMEATGNYHLPIAQYLKQSGYTVYIINPLEMKRYRCQGIRNPKTDSIDAAMIAQYFERIVDHATNIAEWVIYSLKTSEE